MERNLQDRSRRFCWVNERGENMSSDLFEYNPLSMSKGEVRGHKVVQKFGRALSGMQIKVTDIWDRADAAPTQSIWTAPTAARKHVMLSTSVNDSAGGTGMRTVEVFGLRDWAEKETNETITLMGPISSVVTTHPYVIIHRMKGKTFGSGGSANLGEVRALAQADSTITAQILVKEGQTQMAIYGIPSVQDAYMTSFYTNILRAGGAAVAVDIKVVTNPEPDSQLTTFVTKHTTGVTKDGSSHSHHVFDTPKKFPGPCIIKLQGVASSADTDCSGGFDLILVDK